MGEIMLKELQGFPTDKIVIDQIKLREVSCPTTLKEVNDLKLWERLRAANDYAWMTGCGLAAIQIGVPLRFSWFRWGEQEFMLLNPEIISRSGKNKALKEGCLSIPNNWIKIRRYYKIKYMSDGMRKTAKGLKAQIIQHEIDHMDGILNIDKAIGQKG